MADLTIPQEAVEAAFDAIAAGMPVSDAAYAAVRAAAPVLLAFHLRGVADEMRDARSWLAERHLSDSPGPGLLLATIRASLYATADRLHLPKPDTREGILAAVGLTEADMQERADG